MIETGTPDEIEVEMIRDDGTTCWTLLRGEARRGTDDSVVAIQGIVQDIDKRKTAELALQQERDFSKNTVAALPGIFYLLGEHGQLMRWNETLREVSGYSAAELTRMPVLDFFKESDKSLVAERMQQVFSEGHSSVEASFVAKDRTQTPYLFSGKLLMFEGKPCVVGLGIDITKLKQAEEKLRDSEASIACCSMNQPMRTCFQTKKASWTAIPLRWRCSDTQSKPIFSPCIRQNCHLRTNPMARLLGQDPSNRLQSHFGIARIVLSGFIGARTARFFRPKCACRH